MIGGSGLRRALAIGLCVWILGLVGVLATSPGQLWVLHYHAWPDAPGAVILLVCVGLCWSPIARRRLVHHAALAVLLTAYGLWSFVPPLGDYSVWIRHASQGLIGYSDLLANVVYRLAYVAAGVEGMQFVAPVAGAVFVFTLFRVADRVCVVGSDDVDGQGALRQRRFCDLACLAGFWHVLFTRNYLENAQLALPCLLLAALSLHRYASVVGSRRALLYGAGWWALAATVHGQAFAFLPALPLTVWLAQNDRSAGQRWRDLLAVALLAGVLLVSVPLLVWSTGLYVYQGNIHSLLFVPVYGHPMSRYTMFGLEHFRFCGNVLVLATPLVIGLPVLLCVPSLRANLIRAASGSVALLFLGLGYCGFTFCVLFMLDFPRDADLALGTGVLLHILLLRVLCVADAPRHGLAWIVLVIGGAIAWSSAASIRITPPIAEASFLVNGRTDRVTVRWRERVVFQVRGKPDAPFRIEAREPQSTTPIELHTGRAPWTSSAEELRRLGRRATVTLLWTGTDPPLRDDSIEIEWLHDKEDSGN